LTEESEAESWEEWLAASEPDPDAVRYKWGWNPTDLEVVWKLSGPGDGFPEHAVELGRAWGRELDLGGDDMIGDAEYHPAKDDSPSFVAITAFYDSPIPSEVVESFRALYPDAEIRV
jgi:hypothetical protein